jgi:epoxyqueuosine reductase QueG
MREAQDRTPANGDAWRQLFNFAAAFQEPINPLPVTISRTIWRSLLRNVCVALGTTGDASALLHLQKVAKDSEPLIAEHARWAVERIRGKKLP